MSISAVQTEVVSNLSLGQFNIRTNQSSTPNYGDHYCNGEAISSAVELDQHKCR